MIEIYEINLDSLTDEIAAVKILAEHMQTTLILK